MSTTHLHSQDFAECLHTIFQCHDPAGPPVDLELISVNEKTASSHTEQFSLTFAGPSSPVLSQQIRKLTHEKLGELNLFVVPLGPQDGVMSYEVVFNRVRSGVAPAR